MQCTSSQWPSDTTAKLHSSQNTRRTPEAQVTTPLQGAQGTEPSLPILECSVASSMGQGPLLGIRVCFLVLL